jgi:hypothetical protein
MTKLKTYRVSFTDGRSICIDVKAPTVESAFEEAERLYLEGDPDDRRFIGCARTSFDSAQACEVIS